MIIFIIEYMLPRFAYVGLPLLMTIVIIIRLYSRHISRDLPGECSRSPFGFIEPHIGKSCKNIKREFLRVYIILVNLAIENKEDILMDTYLISKEHIGRTFGSAAEFMEPSLLQKPHNFFSALRHGKKNKRIYYRCVIHINELSDTQIIKIRKKLKDLKERFI